MTYSVEKIQISGTRDLAKARILMLHGHAESGAWFQTKTRRLERKLSSIFPSFPAPNAHPDYPGGFQLYYPTGPLLLTPADITQGSGAEIHSRHEAGSSSMREKDLQAWAWGTGDFHKNDEINGLSQSVTKMLQFVNTHGPFIGAVGFSCGATLAAILASLLEAPKIIKGFQFPQEFNHPPLKFAVCYSGFMLTCPKYKSVYNPKIRTPILHVAGKYDPMTDEQQTLALASRCLNSRIIFHPGTHFVPTRNNYIEIVTDFIEIALGAVADSDGNSDDENWVDIE